MVQRGVGAQGAEPARQRRWFARGIERRSGQCCASTCLADVPIAQTRAVPSPLLVQDGRPAHVACDRFEHEASGKQLQRSTTLSPTLIGEDLAAEEPMEPSRVVTLRGGRRRLLVCAIDEARTWVKAADVSVHIVHRLLEECRARLLVHGPESNVREEDEVDGPELGRTALAYRRVVVRRCRDVHAPSLAQPGGANARDVASRRHGAEKPRLCKAQAPVASNRRPPRRWQCCDVVFRRRRPGRHGVVGRAGGGRLVLPVVHGDGLRAESRLICEGGGGWWTSGA